MSIPTDKAEKILVEIMQGKQPKTPDTPEEAEFRQRLIKQVADIQAQGLVVDVPHELFVSDDDNTTTNDNAQKPPGFNIKD
jgi:hypothetical protein